MVAIPWNFMSMKLKDFTVYIQLSIPSYVNLCDCPAGKMYPSQGDLHVAPFTDEALYMEQFTKANFWYQESFHGVNLTCLREAAVAEYFKQPIVVSLGSFFVWSNDNCCGWNYKSSCLAAIFLSCFFGV